MIYPKSREEKLDLKLFENPTSEYRCAPFWAWNCDLKKEELLKEIEFIKEMGMGGFMMHTRVGMSTKYLSDEYMELAKSCCDKAKKLNLLTWLYDEDKWPSGFAGGYITKKKENRQKYLMFTTVPVSENDVIKDNVHSNALGSRTPDSELIARHSVVLDNEGYLVSYKMLDEDEEATEGKVWYTYFCHKNTGPWYNFTAYSDTLSKKTIDEFINVTHEKYKEVLGDEFGKNIPAIFTDEPQMTHKTLLDFALKEKDVFIPYTDDFDETYKAAYGDSILEKLPEIFWDKKGVANTTRYRFIDHSTERFVEAFADNIGTWCEKNNIPLTGHMLMEATLGGQTACNGEAMRSFRRFGLPGVDMLLDSREYTTVKQAASAAHQYGREGVVSELYGVTNWDFDFRGHIMQGDWQAALGVTGRVPHLYWVSMKGEAKRDYPASIGHQSAWYKEYSFVEDHYARINTIMTRGTADVRIGIIHPIESFWVYYGPNDLTSNIKTEINKRFFEVTNWLLFDCLDFDYICESLLPEQYNESDNGFTVGKMKYDVVIVPACYTLRSSTLNALKQFKAKGGKVIFMGDAPIMIDAEFNDEGKNFAKICDQIPWDKTSLIDAVENYRTVKITGFNGVASSNLLYSLRDDKDAKNLFVAHVNQGSRKRIPDMEKYYITVMGEYVPTVMDTFTGETKQIAADYIDGNTVIKWHCYEHSSLLLRLEPGRSQIEDIPNNIKTSYEYLNGAMDYTLSEPNVCVLDIAKWRIDDGEWQEKEEMLRICDTAKEMLGFSTAATQGAQPWCVEYQEPKNSITLEVKFNSDIEYDDAILALEDFDISEIEFNGRHVEKNALGYYVDFSITKVNVGKINKGENTIVIKKPFNVISCVENMFLLGNFGVKVLGDTVKIVDAEDKIYFGDWTTQGLPFYGGLVTYHCKVKGGVNAQLALGLYSGTCVTAELDGKRVGNISLAPYKVDLGNLSAGEHSLDITVHASRINTFGAFHLSKYDLKWMGPNAWHTSGTAWSYEYRLYESGLLTAPRIIKY